MFSLVCVCVCRWITATNSTFKMNGICLLSFSVRTLEIRFAYSSFHIPLTFTLVFVIWCSFFVICVFLDFSPSLITSEISVLWPWGWFGHTLCVCSNKKLYRFKDPLYSRQRNSLAAFKMSFTPIKMKSFLYCFLRGSVVKIPELASIWIWSKERPEFESEAHSWRLFVDIFPRNKEK